MRLGISWKTLLICVLTVFGFLTVLKTLDICNMPWWLVAVPLWFPPLGILALVALIRLLSGTGSVTFGDVDEMSVDDDFDEDDL